MKVFISQRFRDLPEQEVLNRRQMIIDLVKFKYGKTEDVEIIESWHPNFDKNSIAQLGQSIIEMSSADLVLISYDSVLNIFRFALDIDYNNSLNKEAFNSIKGSEFEVLICRSYNIPILVYKFVFNEDKNVVSGVQFINMKELE